MDNHLSPDELDRVQAADTPRKAALATMDVLAHDLIERAKVYADLMDEVHREIERIRSEYNSADKRHYAYEEMSSTVVGLAMKKSYLQGRAEEALSTGQSLVGVLMAQTSKDAGVVLQTD